MSKGARNYQVKSGLGKAHIRKTITLTHTKNLLGAALKVWELKNGYRPEPSFRFGKSYDAYMDGSKSNL